MNSEKYGKQLNLTRLLEKLFMKTIKNKLFEIAKEFKEFKFRQNLRVYFTKNDEDLVNKVFANLWLDSEKLEFNDTNINKLLDI